MHRYILIITLYSYSKCNQTNIDYYNNYENYELIKLLYVIGNVIIRNIIRICIMIELYNTYNEICNMIDLYNINDVPNLGLFGPLDEYEEPSNPILDINQYSIQIEHILDKCSICYIEYNKDDDIRKLLVCDHNYHIKCINTWITEYNNITCPLCRKNIDLL
jgi:hypothetical protein